MKGRVRGRASPVPEEATLIQGPEWRVLVVLSGAIAIALAIPVQTTKLAVMAVVGLFYVTTVFRDYPLALSLVPFLIPAQNLVPRNLFPIPMLNYETLLMVLLLAGWASDRSKPGRAKTLVGLPAFARAVLVFIALLVLAAGATFTQGEAGFWELFGSIKNQFVYVVILFVMGDSLRGVRERVRMMVATCLAFVLISIRPVWDGAMLMAAGVDLERHRAVSLIALQPNIYGGALAVFLPFPLVYMVRRLGGRKGFVFFGISLAVAAYALVLTLSRGSWLAFAAAVSVIGLMFERRVLLVLVLGAALGPLWVPDVAVERAETVKEIDINDPDLEDEAGSSFIRVDQWRTVVPMLADSPIGHGYRTFPRLYAELGSLGREKGAHVGYAEYAGELGLPGLAVYGLVFVLLFLFGLRLARTGWSEFDRAHGIGLMGAALAMMVAECFGSRFKVGTVTAFLWIYAGVAVAASRWASASASGDRAAVPRLVEAAPPRRKRARRTAPPVGEV